jgi:hypothetical protein
MQETPIIMGEFGAFVTFFDSTESAAHSLVAWQVESCEFGFDGWLTWTWDDSTVGEVLPAVAGQSQIAEWLSPNFRPDPCEIGSALVQNLSLGASVAVSSGSLPGELKEYAIDGLSATQWGAGLSAPQWIEIDLGSTHSIKEFKLLIAQWPEGETVHRIHVRDENGANREVHTFSQLTKTDDWLVYQPESPIEGVRFVRIETLASPSWVAWKEIQILGK